MSRIARSFCRYTLNFSRNFQTLFKVVAWSCASSRCVEFQLLLGHRHTCFGVVFVCLIVEGLVGGASGFLIVALICISLTNDVEHFVMWLLVIPISSLMKHLFKYSFLLLSFKSFLDILDNKSFFRKIICKCFLPVCGLSFHFLNGALKPRSV